MSKPRSGNGKPADAMTPCIIAGAAILPSPLIRKSAAMRSRPTAPTYGLSLSMFSPLQCGRSGRAGAPTLQGCRPPQKIVDQRPGGRLQFRQAGFYIASPVVSPEGGDWDVHRRANPGELKL